MYIKPPTLLLVTTNGVGIGSREHKLSSDSNCPNFTSLDNFRTLRTIEAALKKRSPEERGGVDPGLIGASFCFALPVISGRAIYSTHIFFRACSGRKYAVKKESPDMMDGDFKLTIRWNDDLPDRNFRFPRQFFDRKKGAVGLIQAKFAHNCRVGP